MREADAAEQLAHASESCGHFVGDEQRARRFQVLRQRLQIHAGQRNDAARGQHGPRSERRPRHARRTDGRAPQIRAVFRQRPVSFAGKKGVFSRSILPFRGAYSVSSAAVHAAGGHGGVGGAVVGHIQRQNAVCRWAAPQILDFAGQLDGALNGFRTRAGVDHASELTACGV